MPREPPGEYASLNNGEDPIKARSTKLEAIFEILFGLIIEVGGNLLTQILFELGLNSLAAPFRSPERRHPVLAFFGCIILGTIAGFLSVAIFPNHLYHPKHLQGYSLLFVPLSCGAAMAGIRRYRERHGKQVLFLDSFMYGYTFAFFMTLVRFYQAV